MVGWWRRMGLELGVWIEGLRSSLSSVSSPYTTTLAVPSAQRKGGCLLIHHLVVSITQIWHSGISCFAPCERTSLGVTG